jgi:DNA-binding helix-turn-helix protein
VKGEHIMYENFSKLLQKHSVTPYKVSKETGVSQSTLSDWKRGISTPKPDKLQKIADYFDVPLTYFLTETTEVPAKGKTPKLTSKNERDIEKALKETLEQLNSQDGLMFDGEALDDNTKELLKISLENTIRTAKIAAKKKFTPKSLQNGDD